MPWRRRPSERSPACRRRASVVILPRSFYERPTLHVAADLIGKVLLHETRSGIASGVIVEAEAYIGENDPACHAAPGPTARNAPLYGPPGVAYVYLNYGIHYLVNAVTEAEGRPAAILIRALEPKDGLPLMRRRRAAGSRARPSQLLLHDLCRGPGNLTKALGITLRQNCLDLTRGPLRVEDQAGAARPLVWTRRIGITVGVEQEWRVLAADSSAVSGGRAGSRGRGTTISHRGR